MVEEKRVWKTPAGSEIVRLVIDPGAEGYPLVERIVDRVAGRIPIETKTGRELKEEIEACEDPVGYGKKLIFLTHNTGEKVIACPGTKCHICCGYQIISPLSGCPMDCSYCFLQPYLKYRSTLTLDVDIEKVTNRLREILSRTGYQRWGTGEFSDSLALEEILPFHGDIINTVLEYEDRFIELKTKSVFKPELIPADPRVMIGFSLNVEEVVEREEKLTASLETRLAQARAVIERGFSVCFHFDPVIDRDDLLDSYRELFHRVTEMFPIDRVGYISLGTLRFHSDLAKIMRYRNPDSRLFEASFIKAPDGKWRYPENRRIRIYRRILEGVDRAWLERIYLCMESGDVTRAVFGEVYNLWEKLDKCVMSLKR